jgi:hypothetical protein
VIAASSFTSVPIADGAVVGGWVITLVLTFLLIGVPALYALVLTFAADDDAFDRAVSDIEEQVKVKRRPVVVAEVTNSTQEDEDEVHAVDPLGRRGLGALQPSR